MQPITDAQAGRVAEALYSYMAGRDAEYMVGFLENWLACRSVTGRRKTSCWCWGYSK